MLTAKFYNDNYFTPLVEYARKQRYDYDSYLESPSVIQYNKERYASYISAVLELTIGRPADVSKLMKFKEGTLRTLAIELPIFDSTDESELPAEARVNWFYGRATLNADGSLKKHSYAYSNNNSNIKMPF